MKKVLSLGIVRGLLAGLAGTAAGAGVMMLFLGSSGLPGRIPGLLWTVAILIGLIAYLAAVGVFGYWLRWAIGAPEKEEKRPERSWTRYFGYSTNHKVIGIQYLFTALCFLPFAVALQLVARFHMSKLGPSLIDTGTYESFIGDHGIVMLFVVVVPAVGGLMNYLVPLLIGARDVAFPRLNAFTYWLVPPAGLLAVFSLFVGGFDTGWTVYPPMSSQFEPLGMDLVLLGIYVAGLSSILTGVNLLVTIFKMRAPGMNLFRMPVLVWSSMATTGLTLVFTQFLAVSFLMVLLERIAGMGFFRPEMGGNVLLYQHLFWFYSHPAVYIFVLPGLGIISEIIPVFARKPLFGYKAVAISSPGIASGGMLVWGHHMFAAGIEGWMRIPFMITTLLVSVPTGVKIFAWVTTMFLGRLRMTTAFLFVLSAIISFLIGGLTGVPLGIVPVDLYLHDTYWVVAHFHAMLFGGFLYPLMAAIYYWFPKMFGRMLGERLGRAQWLSMTVGGALLFLPMFALGLGGLRRRVADYDPGFGFQPLHVITTIGGAIVFLGLVLMAVNIVRSSKHGPPAGPNPWDSYTLEWQTSSPPPEDNFIRTPHVVGPPYPYGIAGARHAETSDPGSGERISQ